MQNKGDIKKYDNFRRGIRCSINPLESDFSLHHHNYIEIEYLVSGRMKHELNGVQTILGEGDCYCLGLRDMHRFWVLEPGEIYSFCIDYRDAPAAVQQLLRGASLPAVGRFEPGAFQEAKEWFLRLRSMERDRSPFAEEQISALGTLLLIQILKTVAPVSVNRPLGGYHHIVKAMEYMEAHFQEQLKLSDVARAVYLSPNHFSSLFAKVNGHSFSEYLSEVRIRKAMQLLAETDRGILDIAFDCGFGSFSAFSRKFKSYCGCSPSYYRSSIENFEGL